MHPAARLVKPATLVPVVIAAALFGILALHFQHANLSAPMTYVLPLFVGVLLAMANLAGNTLGEAIAGRPGGEDTLNPRTKDRAVASGAISPDGALSIAIVVWGVALVLSFWVSLNFGTVMAAITLFAFLYEMPPSRLKRRLWVSNAAIATPRGFMGVWAAWIGNGGSPWDRVILLAGVLFSVYVYCVNTSKDLSDIKADAQTLHRTLPVVYGEGFGRGIVALGAFLPFTLYGLLFVWAPGSLPWPFLLGFVPAGLLAYLALGRKDDDWRFRPRVVWYGFYSVLGMMSLLYVVGWVGVPDVEGWVLYLLRSLQGTP